MAAGSPAVLTITPNPSLDLLFDAPALVWDDANRVAEPRRRAGGQGINVARAVRALGGDATAIALLGGDTGRLLESMLAADGLPLDAVPVPGETRIFVAVREEATARSLLINPRGPACPAASRDALLAALERRLRDEAPAWVACCGSIPPGAPPDLYARMARVARSHGARFVPDADGEALRLAAEAGCDLLVPNRHEAERLLDCPIRSVHDAASAAEALRARFGVDLAAITLGPEGAVAAGTDGIWHVAAEPGTGSAVGAGDAFLAALILALRDGDTTAAVLRRAVAAGCAVLRSTGADLLDRSCYEAIRSRAEPRTMQ